MKITELKHNENYLNKWMLKKNWFFYKKRNYLKDRDEEIEKRQRARERTFWVPLIFLPIASIIIL